MHKRTTQQCTYKGLGAFLPVEVGHDGASNRQSVLIASGEVIRHTRHPAVVEVDNEWLNKNVRKRTG